MDIIYTGQNDQCFLRRSCYMMSWSDDWVMIMKINGETGCSEEAPLSGADDTISVFLSDQHASIRTEATALARDLIARAPTN